MEHGCNFVSTQFQLSWKTMGQIEVKTRKKFSRMSFKLFLAVSLIPFSKEYPLLVQSRHINDM